MWDDSPKLSNGILQGLKPISKLFQILFFFTQIPFFPFLSNQIPALPKKRFFANPNVLTVQSPSSLVKPPLFLVSENHLFRWQKNTRNSLFFSLQKSPHLPPHFLCLGRAAPAPFSAQRLDLGRRSAGPKPGTTKTSTQSQRGRSLGKFMFLKGDWFPDLNGLQL